MISRVGIFLSVIVLGIVVMAQTVNTDYDHSFDFSQLHSFYAKIGTSWGNPLSENRVKQAVTDALMKKGWTPAADEASADAVVVIHGATQNKQSLNTFYSGGPYGGWGWGGFGGVGTATTTTTTYRVGTLVVDIFSAKDKKMVFRGVGQDEISEKPEKNEKKVQKATEKMFKKFPPETKEGKQG